MYFGTTAVRGADATTFEALLEPWARDKAGVYFQGRKVSRARSAQFAAFTERFGADDKHVFYVNDDSPHVIRGPRRKELDFSDIRCVFRDGLLLVYSGQHVFSAANWGLVGPLRVDGASFVVLGQKYGKDAERVWWFDSHALPQELAGADAESFVVDGEGPRDRNGRFVRHRRHTEPLPVEREADAEQAAPARIDRLWRDVLPRWFELFDSVLPNDQPWSAPQPPPLATAIPEHRLVWHDGFLVLEAEGRSVRGKASGMEILAGWLFGVARRKFGEGEVSIRVLPGAEHVFTDTNGAPPPWQTVLDLAFVLNRLGHTGEARLLLARVVRAHSGMVRTNDVETDPMARAEKLLPALSAALPRPPSVAASTTQSAAKWIVEHGLHQSPDPVVRRDVAELLAALTRATTVAVVRLAEAAAPLVALLDDDEPAVVAKAAPSADLLCSKLFYHHDYEAALTLCEALSRQGFNLDIQSARRWECLAVLGRDDEAEAAWATAERMNAGERAPRQHAGLHPDYPSFEIWRAFGEVRIAVAHMWAAGGQHPSEELRKKKRRLAAEERSAEEWTARATGRIGAARERMERLVQTEPAHAIGPIVCEFTEDYARATGHGRIEASKGFFMRSDYVQYRRYGIPFECTGGRIEAAGAFRQVRPRVFEFAAATTPIMAALGGGFGVEYRFLGRPTARALPARVRVTRPDAGAAGPQEYPVMVFLGLREQFVWRFDSADELIPGHWRFEIVLCSADPPQEYPHSGPLTPKEPIASLEQSFTIALA